MCFEVYVLSSQGVADIHLIGLTFLWPRVVNGDFWLIGGLALDARWGGGNDHQLRKPTVEEENVNNTDPAAWQ